MADLPDFISFDEAPSGGGSGGLPDLIPTQDVLALSAKAPQSSGWNWGDSAKNFASGTVEGVGGLIGLLSDLNPFLPPSVKQNVRDNGYSGAFPISQMVKGYTDEVTAAPDPNYRYARTAGQFLGPGLAGAPFKAAGVGANTALEMLTSQATPLALASAASGSVGAQGAQDLTGDTVIAPILGALAAGSLPSIASNSLSSLKAAFLPATEAEVQGSAALAFKDATQLTPQQIEAAIASRPQDALGAKMTTAEITQNAGAAQLEKSLAASGQPGMADAYNARGGQREAARNAMLNSMTPVEAVNKEGLGSRLIDKATEVKQQLSDAAMTLWEKLPRDIPIKTSGEKLAVSSVANSRGGFGEGLPSRTRNLVDQFLGAGKTEGKVITTGALQDIRSDALRFLRDKDVTPFETRVLNTLRENIDSAMEKNLSGTAFEDWLAARRATATGAELFSPSTVGGALTREGANPSTALTRAFKGDSRSVEELQAALHRDPQLFEEVKRGVLDTIGRDTAGNLTPAKMKKFVTSNEEGLKALFGEEHYGQMTRIFEDLASEAGVKDLATRASKGGSSTAQNLTVAGVVNDLAVGSLLPKTGVLAKAAEKLQGVFGAAGNADKVKEILFRASLEPDFALLLSKAPTDTRVFNLADRLSTMVKDAGFFGATSATLEGARTQESQRSPARAVNDLASSARIQNSARPSAASSPKSLSEAAQQQLGVRESRISSPDSLASSAENQAPRSYQDGLGQLLDAVKHVESRGNTKAVSPVGAKGPYQLMDATGKEYHDKLGIKAAYDPFDESQSRQIAAAILQDYYQMFGDWNLAVQAYHTGPGNIRKGKIGPEGKAYPGKIMAALEQLTGGMA